MVPARGQAELDDLGVGEQLRQLPPGGVGDGARRMQLVGQAEGGALLRRPHRIVRAVALSPSGDIPLLDRHDAQGSCPPLASRPKIVCQRVVSRSALVDLEANFHSVPMSSPGWVRLWL